MSMSNDASSDSESRPTKRQRIESERIEKSTSIYHAHGDIAILSLPNDEGVITAFKIDKIYLSRNSAVFEGMVGLPSMEESEKFDGVPLVRLQDTAEQLGDFLEALYDSGKLKISREDEYRFEIIERILIMADKYQVDHLHRTLVKMLEEDWPTTLEAWDENEKYLYDLQSDMPEPFLDGITPEPCAAIRLAMRCHVPSILPAAFYHLVRLSPAYSRRVANSCYEGLSLEDEELFRTYLEDGGRTAELELLAPEDFLCLIRGKEALKKYFDRMSTGSIKGLDDAHKADGCRKSCSYVSANTAPRGLKARLLDDFDLLNVVKQSSPSSGKKGRPGYCPIYTQWVTQEREEIWDNLPVFFQLETKPETDED